MVFFCDPAGIRTPNLRIRSAVLYPVKLQGLLFCGCKYTTCFILNKYLLNNYYEI
jgi:hypothetical protein